MAATDSLFVRAEPLLRSSVRHNLRAALPLPVLILAWWFVRLPLDGPATLGLVIYALVNLALIFPIRRAWLMAGSQSYVGFLMASVVSDALLAIYLLSAAGPLTLGIFPIYLVMVLKALCYRRIALWTMLVPALLGPLDLALLYYRERSTAFSANETLAFWGLVSGSVLFVVLLLALAEYRLFQLRGLSWRLEAARLEHAERVTELESVNQDLRVRIRRQQALDESLRAITSSLSLDDVLGQILDSLVQMLGSPQIRAAALTLIDHGQFHHRTLGGDAQLQHQTSWAEALAQQVVTTRVPLIVSDTLHEAAWHHLHPTGIAAALSVPLIDPHDQVLGALTVVSTQRYLFTATEVRHLTSFSIQASVAIYNARLHSELARQRQTLAAVLRDIGDGLLVVDGNGELILGNPVAYQALQHSDSQGGTLRETLDRLNREVRSAPTQLLTIELTVGNDDQERHYLIYASVVRVEGEPEELTPVAFALHDVTEQKLQEKQRVEFISMVSHELRNPLNTLNGFLKVVLQGKAGALNDLQQEFLGLANEQADALKGRITELLEFNRLEAGRLRLQPQWSNLTDLLLTTGARFQVQASDFGLTLHTDVPERLPDLLMDAERVGQVITNLIENAMKATPAGGMITLSAELDENEVRVHVRDTGIGIPADQRAKIFDRFYRLEHKASKHGAHLGLGLSICQQIVEGHNGQIWVESEEGQGSCFTFSLPLVQKAQTLSEAMAQD
ncbi:MAG: ATP-binding protein [Oscillochloridaceae bacterium umkhey_bin13]